MNIKILSDSTCDLSQAILEENNITVVPLTVIKDDKEYKDGVTITPAEIFENPQQPRTQDFLRKVL